MTRAMCRTCGDEHVCQEWTLHAGGVTGQCNQCLQDCGPDDDCGEPPEEQDEAEARAEREYRNLDRGEL